MIFLLAEYKEKFSSKLILTRKVKLRSMYYILLLCKTFLFCITINDGAKIEKVESVGIILQHNSKFNKHCMNVIRLEAGKSNMEYDYSTKFDTTVVWMKLVKLHYTTIKGQCYVYNIKIWDEISQTNMKKVQSFWSKYLNLRPHQVTFKQIHKHTFKSWDISNRRIY